MQLVSFFLFCFEHLSVSSLLCVYCAHKHHLFIYESSWTEKGSPVNPIHGFSFSSWHVLLTLKCKTTANIAPFTFWHFCLFTPCWLYQTLPPSPLFLPLFNCIMHETESVSSVPGDSRAGCTPEAACSRPMIDTNAVIAVSLGCWHCGVWGKLVSTESRSCVTDAACQWFTEISSSALFLETAFSHKCISNSRGILTCWQINLYLAVGLSCIPNVLKSASHLIL